MPIVKLDQNIFSWNEKKRIFEIFFTISSLLLFCSVRLSSWLAEGGTVNSIFILWRIIHSNSDLVCVCQSLFSHMNMRTWLTWNIKMKFTTKSFLYPVDSLCSSWTLTLQCANPIYSISASFLRNADAHKKIYNFFLLELIGFGFLSFRLSSFCSTQFNKRQICKMQGIQYFLHFHLFSLSLDWQDLSIIRLQFICM